MSAGCPELVPFGFDGELLLAGWATDILSWMEQKDQLGQDMFIIGNHGPLRRWIALAYCARMGHEMEYLALTQDTTEADLKQRRELVAGGTAQYFDQVSSISCSCTIQGQSALQLQAETERAGGSRHYRPRYMVGSS